MSRPPRAEPQCRNARPVRHAVHGGSAIAVLAVAAFVIVTTEFLIIGLLPALARDLGTSTAMAGQLVTLFAVVVALAGPPLTAWLAPVGRRRLFVAIALLFAGSNALAALAPDLGVLALARLLPAMALPVFWGTASETAAQLAGPARAGRAVASVYLGISAALLLGIPLGTLAAEAVGWRGAFALLALLSLLVAVALAYKIPALQPAPRASVAQQLGVLRSPRFMAHAALSVLVFTAMFTAYTYLAEILERAGGVAPARVGWWLMGFGAIGLAGNWLGGRWAERQPLAATAALSLLLGLGMVATVQLAQVLPWLVAALAVWAIANTALYPVCQIRVMQAAPQAQALAGTVNVSAANAGIALGAMLGGGVLQAWGPFFIGWAAAGLAMLAALAAALMGRPRHQPPA